MKKYFCHFLLFLFACVSATGTEKKLLIISDVFHAVGGTEEVISQISRRMMGKDFIVKHISLEDVPTFSIDSKDFRIASPIGLQTKLGAIINDYKPTHILIVLLGLSGHYAGIYCYENNMPFTLFMPSRVVDHLKSDYAVPMWLSNAYLKRFLPKATKILVPTQSVADQLTYPNLKNVQAWPHGADTDRFVMYSQKEKNAFIKSSLLSGKERPFYLYVGRLSKPKNIQAFLDLEVPGTKVLVGAESLGYEIESLKKKYPECLFPGPQTGNELVGYFACSDIFVFPCKLDTFGIVQVEALACGLPVVAFDVIGPKDVVPRGCGVSYLCQNQNEFQDAAMQAWADRKSGAVTPKQCREFAERYSWDQATETLIDSLEPIDWNKISQH